MGNQILISGPNCRNHMSSQLAFFLKKKTELLFHFEIVSLITNIANIIFDIKERVDSLTGGSPAYQVNLNDHYHMDALVML